MSDYRTTIERDVHRVGHAGFTFEDLRQRRDRKSRNQRIRAALVAAVIAVLAIGGLIRAFSTGERPQPASPSITSTNVSQLRPSWSAPTAGRFETTSVPLYTSITAAEGKVFTALWTLSAQGRLEAFPATCGDASACSPSWIAHTGALSRPTVSGGVVYVADIAQGFGPDNGGPGVKRPSYRLYAFPTACGTEGAICEPLWTGDIGEGALLDVAPVVADGSVFIGGSGRVYAFPVGCGSGGATCRPLWVGPTGGFRYSSVSEQGGIVYVAASNFGSSACSDRCGELLTFPADCGTNAATCTPLSTTGFTEGIHEVVADGSSVFVAGDGVVQALADECLTTRGDCPPLWTGSVPGGARVSVSSGSVFAAGEGRLYSFPSDCGVADARCQPTWSVSGNYGYVSKPQVLGSLVFAPTYPSDASTYAYAAACPSACSDLWSGSSDSTGAGAVALGEGAVYVAGGGAVTAYAIPPAQPRGVASSDRGTLIFYLSLLAIAAALIAIRHRRRTRS